jgi:hypothetical protein
MPDATQRWSVPPVARLLDDHAFCHHGQPAPARRSFILSLPALRMRLMARLRAVAVGTCLLLAGPIVLAGCGGNDKPAAGSTTTVTRHVQKLPANAIRIHWKQKALVAAPRAGHVCVVTYKTGRFCASYLSGEIPAVALKRELRAKGWIVVESK